MADQHEKAFQKQDAVFIGAKRSLAGGKKGKLQRYWRNPGLSFQCPKEAKEGRFVDKKCPFTGNVSIRGRIMKGMCTSAGKMKNTITMRRTYLHYIKKFNRFEKRHTQISVHASPAFDIKEGDIITAGECRPIAKTVSFNVVKGRACRSFRAAAVRLSSFPMLAHYVDLHVSTSVPRPTSSGIWVSLEENKNRLFLRACPSSCPRSCRPLLEELNTWEELNKCTRSIKLRTARPIIRAQRDLRFREEAVPSVLSFGSFRRSELDYTEVEKWCRQIFAVSGTRT